MCTASVRDGVRVLVSVVHSRRIGVPSEVARLLPPVPRAFGAAWWTEVIVPWGDPEADGVAIALALAATMDGARYDPLAGRPSTGDEVRASRWARS